MKDRKNPIKLQLIGKDEFQITLKLGEWELSKVISESALKELENEINDVTGLTKISETFNCSGADARKIKDFWNSLNNRQLCPKCRFKWKECFNCVLKCDSPLERDLLLELRKNEIETVMQRRINKDGTFYEFPQNIDFDHILTIPDFYIEKGNVKLCVYADGHTYHERTEKQALRDRNIDRELQRMGFKVLRYTGQEIRMDRSQVVENIIKNLE